MSTELDPRIAKRVKMSDGSLITRMLDISNGLEDVIRMGRGDPDLDTPAHIVKAGQEALAKGATHYTHPLGIEPLRQAIAEDIRARGGADYAADEIMITPGGQQGMFVIILSLLNPGDEIIVPCPGYNPYSQAADLADAVVRKVPMTMETNFTLTAELVEPHINERSKLLVLINPNNPTGTVTPPDEVRKIAELARENDLIVISDEIYSRLTFGNNTVQPVAAPARLARAHHYAIRIFQGLRDDRLADRLPGRAEGTDRADVGGKPRLRDFHGRRKSACRARRSDGRGRVRGGDAQGLRRTPPRHPCRA